MRDIPPREHNRLAEGACAAPRAAQIEVGQRAGRARRRVRVEDREPVRTLHELHRRAPARVDFNRVRNPVANDEVDAVDADETELLGHRVASAPAASTSARHRSSVASRMFPQYSISRRAERLIADELARDAERHGASAGRNEHDGARRPVDELLQIAAARQRVAAVPAANSLPAAGRERLDEPLVDKSVRLKPDTTYDSLFVSSRT